MNTSPTEQYLANSAMFEGTTDPIGVPFASYSKVIFR
jgi:hypothetical protein